MNHQEYSARAIVLAGNQPKFIHAALGIAGEAGEVVDIVKKVEMYNKPLNHDHLIEELGDLLWYVNLMIQAAGSTWGEVFERNIAKLEARYPDKVFNRDQAINRNKEAEQAAMRG